MNENLAKARAAALNDINLTDNQPAPTWRVIITDSESPTGLAPVCTGEQSDALHMIDDYPGGPQRDEDGVYDCCPYPQVETYSTVWAAYLVALLNADAATVTPDFFQPDRTYTDGTGYTAPELTNTFQVEHVTRHPDRGHLRAIGWMRTGEPDAKWHGDFRDEGEFDGWTDTTNDTTTGDNT